MDRIGIIELLESQHQEVFQWLENQPDEKWITGPEGKWTTGQHILHLVNSEKMLNKALSYPKFLVKRKFGVSNRESRSYSEVAKRYQERLSENQEKARAFNSGLRTPSLKEKKHLMNTLKIQNKKLQYKTKKLKDKHIETLLLPHPLMGRMTLKEIIMWTAHHTEHHLTILKNHY
ncbi:MAG: DinB family protein [Flavobacteriaceae bacterium]